MALKTNVNNNRIKSHSKDYFLDSWPRCGHNEADQNFPIRDQNHGSQAKSKRNHFDCAQSFRVCFYLFKFQNTILPTHPAIPHMNAAIFVWGCTRHFWNDS